MSDELTTTKGEDAEADRPGPGGGKTFLLGFIIVLLVLALAWLVSTINSRKYFLESEKGYLVVKKGMFLPMGTEVFTPEDPELRTIYAPVKLPQGQSVPLREFADRGELDRELFNLLMRWSQDRVYSENPEEFALGAGYMERLGKLKASSDELRKVSSLRGDLSYREGRKILVDATSQLRNAQKKFAEADQQGAAKFTDGGRFVRVINDVVRVIDGTAAAYSLEELELVRKHAIAEFKAASEPRPPDGLTLTPATLQPGQPVPPGAATPLPVPQAQPPAPPPPAIQPAAPTPPKPVPVKK